MQNLSLRDKRRRHMPPVPHPVIAPRLGRWLLGAAAIAVLVVISLPGAQAAPAPARTSAR